MLSFWCRLIFLGTPCDPNQPNVVVTRAMPLTGLYQLKKTSSQALPRYGINVVEGLQMRSVTGQVSVCPFVFVHSCVKPLTANSFTIYTTIYLSSTSVECISLCLFAVVCCCS